MLWLFICVEQKKTKKPNDVLAKHKAQTAKEGAKERPEFKAKPRDEEKSRGDQRPPSSATKNPKKIHTKRKCAVW
jgi:hypothetical protein